MFSPALLLALVTVSRPAGGGGGFFVGAPVVYTPRRVSPHPRPNVVNMLPYLIPEQRVGDPLQWHLEGVGAFQKTIWTGPDTFVLSKGLSTWMGWQGREAAPRAWPSEYFRVVDGVAYNEWETTEWGSNMDPRGFHRADGTPWFEWARDNAPIGKPIPQSGGTIEYAYCDGRPSRLVYFGPTQYFVDVFDLDTYTTGDVGPYRPEWGDIARALNQPHKMMTITGYWGDVREMYLYVHGAGLVGWRWQEVRDGKWTTLHDMNLDKVVWEATPIRALDPCEAP